MENEKWIEIFSQGDIWELEVDGDVLQAFYTGNDHSDYEPDELVDNGISDVYERSRMMRLRLVKVDYNGNEIEPDEPIEEEVD